MAHDIFVSHSNKDKIAADAVVAHLERDGLRCWCAPRDILPGASWASSIVQAINDCKAMVIVFSANANQSDHIRREVERAVNHGIPIVPVRIENVLPQGDLEYFLSSSHWMDAITAPVERHFEELAQQLRALLQMEGSRVASASLPAARPTRRPPARPLIVGAIALLMVAAVAAFLFRSRPESKQVVATNAPSATPQPQSTPVPVMAQASVAQAAAPPAVPTLPSEQSPVGAESSLAAEYRDWKKLTLITWDNYYLIDHARQRYAAWRRAADQGDPIGQFFIGYCYQHGLTVPEDPSTAFEWFTKSAAQKNSDGMFEVAVCCALGLGTQQNVLAYARWINEAVAAGNTSAEVVLGVGMMTFPVGPTDKEQGKRHIAKAAAAGNFDGVFWNGLVNSRSPAEMTVQLQKAAAAGQPDALITLVETAPDNPQGRSMVEKALKMMGNPLMVARIIDSTLPGGAYHRNLFPDVTAARLSKMSSEGSAEATRLLAILTQSGKIAGGP
jgi:TPR repeat protein